MMFEDKIYTILGYQSENIDKGCDMDAIRDTKKEAVEKAKLMLTESAARVLIFNHKEQCVFDKCK